MFCVSRHNKYYFLIPGDLSLRVCQNTLLITEDRYIAELSYEVAI